MEPPEQAEDPPRAHSGRMAARLHHDLGLLACSQGRPQLLLTPRLFRQLLGSQGAAALAAAGTNPLASPPVLAGGSLHVCEYNFHSLVIGEVEQLSLYLLGKDFIISFWFPIRVLATFLLGCLVIHL